MTENALQTIPTAAFTTADNLANLKGLAQVFVQSGLFKDTTDLSKAFVKILKGQELGFPPVASMEMIDIIKGNLFLKPKGAGALINSCGYGAYTTIERSPELCVIRFSRKTRNGWGDLPDVEYSIATARARGLLDMLKNQRGEEYPRSAEWQTDPANMLFWRCLGRGAASYFPELMGGLAPAPDFASEPVSDATNTRNVVDMFGDTIDRDTGEVVHVSLKDPTPGDVVNGTILASASPPATIPPDTQGGQNSDEAVPGAVVDAELDWRQSLALIVEVAEGEVMTAAGKLSDGDALLTEMARLSGMVKQAHDCLNGTELREHGGHNLHMALQAQMKKAQEEKVA